MSSAKFTQMPYIVSDEEIAALDKSIGETDKYLLDLNHLITAEIVCSCFTIFFLTVVVLMDLYKMRKKYLKNKNTPSFNNEYEKSLCV